VGRHPAKVVEAMHRICLGAEGHFDRVGMSTQVNVRFQKIDQAIAMAAMFMAKNVSVQAIVALTESGSTAQWLSRVQSSVPIYALSPNVSSRRRMALYRDVYPVAHHPVGDDMNQVVQDILQILLNKCHLRNGDRVIVTSGEKLGHEGGTNTLRLIQLGSTEGEDDQGDLDLR